MLPKEVSQIKVNFRSSEPSVDGGSSNNGSALSTPRIGTSSPSNLLRPLTAPGTVDPAVITSFNTPIKGEKEARTDAISSYKRSNSPKMHRRRESGGSIKNFDEPLDAELVAERLRRHSRRQRKSKIALYNVRDSPPLHASTSKDDGKHFDEPLEIELIDPHDRKIASYDARDSPKILSRTTSGINPDVPLDVEINDPHKKIRAYKRENSPKILSRRSSRGSHDVPMYDSDHSRISHYDAEHNSPKTRSRKNSFRRNRNSRASSPGSNDIPVYDSDHSRISHHDAAESNSLWTRSRRSSRSSRSADTADHQASKISQYNADENSPKPVHHDYTFPPVERGGNSSRSSNHGSVTECRPVTRGSSSHSTGPCPGDSGKVLSVDASLGTKLRFQAIEFYQSIQEKRGFAFFNIMCLLQTAPALSYYIMLFEAGYSLPNSAGMTAVWPCTIGAISSVIVTLAVGPPLPEKLLSKPFCIVIIAWMFSIALFMFIAAISLGAVKDFHGMGWSLVCCASAILSGIYLVWWGNKVSTEYQSLATRRLEDGGRSTTVSVNASASIISKNDSESEADVELQHIYTELDDKSGSGGADAKESGQSEATSVSSTGPRLSSLHLKGGKHSASSSVAGSSNISEADAEEVETPPAVWKARVVEAIQVFLWLILLVLFVIPIGFGITSSLVAHENVQYEPPGRLLSVKSATVHGESESLYMHIDCVGSASKSRPLILLEPNKGMSGFAYWKLQHALADEYNWRVCTYDKPGYGWSQMSALGSTSNSKKNTARLYELLMKSHELTKSNGQIIIVGHGAGGEIAQVFTYLYPSLVAGMSLLDAYPYHQKLKGLSDRKVENRIDEYCANINMARALESIGLTRPYTDSRLRKAEDDHTVFKPASELSRYRSTMMNNKYYAARYNDACVYTDSIYRATEYLTDVGTELGANGLMWPQVAGNVPVLIIPASETVTKKSRHGLFMEQALLYNSTLSPTGSSRLIICESCDRNFPYNQHATWLAQEIDTYFAATYPLSE